MRLGYERAAILALMAVFIFVFADFRNLRDTLLATVPLLFGGAWLLEAMGAAGMGVQPRKSVRRPHHHRNRRG